MDLQKAKIYNDGSHYIAIRRTTRPKRPKRVKKERVVTVTEEDIILEQAPEPASVENNEASAAEAVEKTEIEQEVKEPIKTVKKPKEMTLKELFNSYYSQTVNVRKRQRKKLLQNAMRKYFDDDKSCADFVQSNIERVQRNFLSRRLRFMRKINMHPFNYFVTFTYDDAIHTEESFRKKLKCYLYHMSQRHDWRYIGVWERSPEKQRLHYHGIFIIPDISVVGELLKKKDFNVNIGRMQYVMQSNKILEKFGRNDFREINSEYTG